MKIDFPENHFVTKNCLAKAQKTLLDMAVKVCSILEKEEIDYMITAGTLLGAVRHKGFIPWDDDFDIFIFDEFYSKAIDALSRDLPAHLIVHNETNDPLYFKSWSSVRNLCTRGVTNDQYNIDNKLLNYQCLSIDLFNIKKIAYNEALQYKKNEAIRFFDKKLSLGIINTSEYYSQLEKLKEVECTTSTESNKEYFYFLVGLKNPVHTKDTFPLKKIEFENNFFYAPSNADAYLRSFYGNYMKLPEYDKRRGHFVRLVISDQMLHQKNTSYK